MNKCGKILGAVFAAALLFWPLAAEAAWQPDLLIGLQKGQTAVKVSVDKAFVIRTVKAHKVLYKGSADKPLTIAYRDGSFAVDDKKLKAGQEAIECIVADERQLAQQVTRINGRSYRGAVQLQPKGAGFTVVNHVTVEEYLRGVVPEEMPPEWNTEAVKAQAVAARTFALSSRKRHASEGYDLCATTHCQQYSGIAAEKAGADRAIKATAGEVLTYRGKLIDALFHTDSGGMTENSEDVWGSRIPYLRAAKEVHTKTYPWEKNITAANLASVLASHGKNVGALKKVELADLQPGKRIKGRTASGRVQQVRFTGKNGTALVSGNDLRSWLGLKSTMFDISLRAGVVFIRGYGWGHGLGLSQWGAKAYAEEKGYKYTEILSNYYAGTTLKKLY